MSVVKNIIASSLIFAFFVTPMFVNAQFKGKGKAKGDTALDVEYNTGLENTEYNKAGNKTVQNIIVKVIRWLLRILAALAVMVLIIAGIMYILSGGDEGRASTAKTWIIYAIIGLIVALLGWVIVSIISNLVAGKDLLGGGGAID